MYFILGRGKWHSFPQEDAEHQNPTPTETLRILQQLNYSPILNIHTSTRTSIADTPTPPNSSHLSMSFILCIRLIPRLRILHLLHQCRAIKNRIPIPTRQLLAF
ncbi:hypothetical protein EYC80_006015 [Monilinia laxa]|uniref:Uncharacterized protein n=1 Tax=Monilinia laxa TaxID=61186 RepID=A0A5N6KGF0_MONLA|nr:hypothetical protein EYC80_006015 [Monilinia laxa]